MFISFSFHHSGWKAISSWKNSPLLPNIARTPQSLFTTKSQLYLMKAHMTRVYFQTSIRHFTYRFPYKGIFQGLTIFNNDILSFNDSMRTPLTWVCYQTIWGGPQNSLFLFNKKIHILLHGPLYVPVDALGQCTCLSLVAHSLSHLSWLVTDSPYYSVVLLW